VDHSTIGRRWVLRSAPEPVETLPGIRPPNRSRMVDETYARVAGLWT
jgi:hypothetical protein